MKARIWKDRDMGWWCFDVQGCGMRCTGMRPTWDGALGEALTEMRLISTAARR